MIPEPSPEEIAAILKRLESYPTIQRMDPRWRRYLAEEAAACVRIARSMTVKFPDHRINVERRSTRVLRRDQTLHELPDAEINAAIRVAMEET
jgi:hypothetical protein